jgi:hypothetical protein
MKGFIGIRIKKGFDIIQDYSGILIRVPELRREL